MAEGLIAVVGAGGAAGHEVLTVLADRGIPAGRVAALSADRGSVREISYGDDAVLPLKLVEGFDFSACDAALFVADAETARKYAPKAAKAGALVIDASDAYRMEPDAPLVVVGATPKALAQRPKRGIAAIPGCAATQLILALAPLHALGGLKRITATVLHATSSAGRNGMDELFEQTRGIFVHDPVHKQEFTKQIAFNLIPQVGGFEEEDGATSEELSIERELRKTLHPSAAISVSAVRTPVFIGHGIVVHAAFDRKVTVEEARKALKHAHGVTVIDHRVDEGYVTPIEAAGDDPVFISRIRIDRAVENGLSFWCVADNLRRGVALTLYEAMESLLAAPAWTPRAAVDEDEGDEDDA